MTTLRLNLDERNTRNLRLTNVVVVFDPPDHAKDTYVRHRKLIPGEQYLFLGEIANMMVARRRASFRVIPGGAQ